MSLATEAASQKVTPDDASTFSSAPTLIGAEVSGGRGAPSQETNFTITKDSINDSYFYVHSGDEHQPRLYQGQVSPNRPGPRVMIWQHGAGPNSPMIGFAKFNHVINTKDATLGLGDPDRGAAPTVQLTHKRSLLKSNAWSFNAASHNGRVREYVWKPSGKGDLVCMESTTDQPMAAWKRDSRRTDDANGLTWKIGTLHVMGQVDEAFYLLLLLSLHSVEQLMYGNTNKHRHGGYAGGSIAAASYGGGAGGFGGGGM